MVKVRLIIGHEGFYLYVAGYRLQATVLDLIETRTDHAFGYPYDWQDNMWIS